MCHIHVFCNKKDDPSDDQRIHTGIVFWVFQIVHLQFLMHFVFGIEFVVFIYNFECGIVVID